MTTPTETLLLRTCADAWYEENTALKAVAIEASSLLSVLGSEELSQRVKVACLDLDRALEAWKRAKYQPRPPYRLGGGIVGDE